MNVFGQEVRTPLVVERSAVGIPIAGAGATTTVVFNVASIHAVYIDVFFQATVALASVSLVLYASNKQIALTQQIHAAALANVVHAVRWGGSLTLQAGQPQQGQAIGQVYDVAVTTANNVADGSVKVWTAARS